MLPTSFRGRNHRGSFSAYFLIITKTAIAATIKPSSHSQYFSRKPGAAASGMGCGAATAGGAAAGVSCCTTGAGAGVAMGSGSTTFWGTVLATRVFSLAFLTTGLGAGCSAIITGTGAGCSAATAGAGVGSTTGACSATTATGAGSATTASFGLVAHADNTSTEKITKVCKNNFFVLDMVFP